MEPNWLTSKRDNWCGMTFAVNSIWKHFYQLNSNKQSEYMNHWWVVQTEMTWESKEAVIRNGIQLMDFKRIIDGYQCFLLTQLGMTWESKETLIRNGIQFLKLF